MAVTLNTRALKSRKSTSDPWQNTTVRADVSLAPVLAITGDGDLSADFAAGDLTEAANELKGETNLALDSIGIVVDGNTAAVNISAGQYVILKNSTITGRDDGLYIAANAVSAGNAVTAADLPGDPNNTGHPLPAGGLNDLRNTLNQYFKRDGLSNPGNMNNTSLIGTYFAQDTACSNLPTTSGYYYTMICFGMYQIAARYSTAGIKTIFSRNYINDQWYPWRNYRSGMEWLAANTDWNTLTENAVYGVPGNTSFINSPVQAGGILEVIAPDDRYGTYIMQRFSTNRDIYIRWKTSTDGTSFTGVGWYKLTGTLV